MMGNDQKWVSTCFVIGHLDPGPLYQTTDLISSEMSPTTTAVPVDKYLVVIVGPLSGLLDH